MFLVFVVVAALDLWLLVLAPNPSRHICLAANAALQLCLCAAGLCLPRQFREARRRCRSLATAVTLWYLSAIYDNVGYVQLPPVECLLLNIACFVLFHVI